MTVNREVPEVLEIVFENVDDGQLAVGGQQFVELDPVGPAGMFSRLRSSNQRELMTTARPCLSPLSRRRFASSNRTRSITSRPYLATTC